MKKKRHFKINKLKLGMIFLVFSMLIGFASLNTKLNFNGSTSLAYSGDRDFKIYFSRAFINDIGKSNIINEQKNAFTVSYSDINRADANLKYTVKNTSNSYYADVEVSCKARRDDGTKFLYDEDNYVSKTFRVEPGKSFTTDLRLLLPESVDDSGQTILDINLADYVKGLSKGSDSGIDFNNLKESGVYENTDTNSGNSIYYYRGTEANNDVIFAERCWKILRTSENGGVKLLYNGRPSGGTCLQLGASFALDPENETIKFDNNSRTKYPDNAYAGYMYGSLEAEDYASTHSNLNDSIVKQKIDAWYEHNMLGSVYEQYLIDDVYYSDRTILEDLTGVNTTSEFTTLGFGTNNTLYAGAVRASSISKSLKPTFKYNNKDDAFTRDDIVNGNGLLTYPVGTITADELVFSGATNVKSGGSWLSAAGRHILTMTPVGYYGDSMNYVTTYPSPGYLSSIPRAANEPVYILPTITLTPDMTIYSGSGTSSKPFILSSENIYENTYTCSLNIDKVGYTEKLESRNPLLDLEVGEEYCFEDECFYTISNDQNGNIKMISKYNLYVGRRYTSNNVFTTIETSDPLYGKQNSGAIGMPLDSGYPRVATIYSESKNPNYDDSNYKPYVDEYVEYLKSITGFNIAGQLITLSELQSLGCTSTSCQGASWDWVTGRAYWTMTASGSNRLYLVGSDGYLGASTGINSPDLRGVRPVITIHIPTKNSNVTFVSGNGENVGDELCIDKECFYVLNYDGENYTLFSKYNLYVGNKFDTGSRTAISTSDPNYGKQNSLALGDKGSPIYGTLNYADSLTAINNYANYLNNTYGLHTTGRGITLGELENPIGCRDLTGSGINHGCNKEKNPLVQYEWVTDTTYWTGAESGDNVYIVGGDGFFKAVAKANTDNRGARPVIIVPALEIKDPDYVVPTESYPSSWNDNGIFSEYYDKAYEKLKTMTTEEKVGQLLVVSYTNSNPNVAVDAIQNYNVGGVLFFADAFEGKSEEQVVSMISNLQVKSKIPLMTQVDEEGGIVTRVARNTNLVSNELQAYPNIFKNYTRTVNNVTSTFNAFKSPSDLYKDSGNNFDLVLQETQVKNSLLKRLGINMNLAPVSDIADSTSYIYKRTLGQDAATTAEFVKVVVENSKNSGVSRSLKHFPGYGNNADTHSSSSVDQTSLEELKSKHLVPFVSGINSGVESVLISHNIISALDKENPASLSYPVHSLLFDELGFTGLAITDDLSMDASSGITNQYIKAFTSGNHILLTSDKYATAYNEILTAINGGNVPMTDLDKRVFKILAWKYYSGLLS